MIKRMVVAAAALLLLLGSSPVAGMTGSTDARAELVTVNGTAYLPAPELARLLGAGILWDAGAQEVYVKTGGSQVRSIPRGLSKAAMSRDGLFPALLNVNSLQVWTRIYLRDGELHLPVDQVLQLAGKQLSPGGGEAGLQATDLPGEKFARVIEEVIQGPLDYRVNFAPYYLAGWVTDPDGRPVADAQIYVSDLDRSRRLPYPTMSGEGGYYSLHRLAPGRWRVVFAREGYEPLSVVRELPDPETGWYLDVTMRPSDQDERSVVETDRFLFDVPKGVEPLPEEMADVTNRLGLMETFLQTRVTRPIRYYQGISEEDVARMVGGSVGGIYFSRDNQVISYLGINNYHEVAHAVADAFNPEINHTLNEGLAVFFGWGNIGSPMMGGAPVTPFAWEFANNGGLPGISSLLRHFNFRYFEAGSLVEFLLKQYGRDRFLDLARTLPHAPTFEEVEAVFQRVYGKSANEMSQEWLVFLDMPPSTPLLWDLEVGGWWSVEGWGEREYYGKDWYLHVRAYADEDRKVQVAQSARGLQAQPYLRWALLVPNPGRYYIDLFIDENQNQLRDPGELAASLVVDRSEEPTPLQRDVILRRTNP